MSSIVRKSLGLVLAGLMACTADGGRDLEDEQGPLGKADGLDDLDLAIEDLSSAALFDAMAFSGQENVVIGKTVKFLIDNRDPDAPQLRWLNANFDGPLSNPQATQFHFFFAREVFGASESGSEFNQVTYSVQDKRYFAGTLQQYHLGDEVLYGIQFYPQDVIAEETVVTGVEQVAKAFSIPDAKLAFVATGQQQTTERVSAKLAALGVDDLTLDGVLGSLDYLPMQLGEAWGFLRIFPESQDDLTAIDIPVFDELPLDLTVVAGTITRAVQDASSHINLKSKERGTPNMVLRSAALDHERLAPFDGMPVHLVVGPGDFRIELSDESTVRAKLAEKTDKPWQPLDVDPGAEVLVLDDLCPDDPSDCLDVASAYGGKVGGLGFLRNRQVLGRVDQPGTPSAKIGYDISPAGVGVPVQRYFDFVALNPELETMIDEFVKLEKDGLLSVSERVAMLEEIRETILAAELPAGLEDEVKDAIRKALGPDAENAKIRSSANAEDIPGFDGAGLYESFRAKLDTELDPGQVCHYRDDDDDQIDIRPRSVGCIMKGVYASLWNKRAVEERSFARIDHATAGMGLAIVERYEDRDDIAANSVVVTRVLNSSGVFGYTFGNQVGNNVVTNPAPGTQSESVIAGFVPDLPSSFTVTRFARPEADADVLTKTVMSEAQMLEMLDITKTVELAYCRAEPDYYPGSCSNVTLDVDKPKSLDMELKLYENGEFLCKQVREFAGR